MLITLQNRLKALIEADSYFAGVPVLVEALGNVAQEYKKAIAKIKFCVVISVPSGVRSSPKPQPAVFQETILISICQGTLTDSQRATRNVNDGMEHVVAAVDRQPIDPDGPQGVAFHVSGHNSGTTEGGEAVQVVEVNAWTQLAFEPSE